MSKSDPWHIDGPDTRAERPALADALRMAHAPARAPTEDDAPPLTTFPMTRAARVALEFNRRLRAPLKSRRPM